MKTQFDAKLLAATASQPAEGRPSPKDAEALKKSCQDFEAIFIQSMFKAMRKTVPDGGIFSRNTGNEMFQEMVDQEIATEIARHQSFGLADQMYRQLEKNLPPEK